MFVRMMTVTKQALNDFIYIEDLMDGWMTCV